MLSNCNKIIPPCSQQEYTNINDIFKPFYYILKLVGLFPYGIKYKASKDTFKIVHNAIYMNSVSAVSSIIIMYTFYFLHVEELHHSNDNNSLSNVLITQMNYILELSTLLIYSTVAYITAFANRYKYVKILNSVASILSESKNKTDVKHNILGRLNFQVRVVSMGSLLFVLILQLCVNSTRDESLWKVTMVTFSFILPQMIQMIGLAFHYILVMMLVAVLSDINEQLRNLTQESKIAVPDNLYVKVNTKGPPLTVRHLQLVYTKAFEIKTDINEAFQASLLISTIQCFHCIVSESYSIYHGLVAQTHTIHNTINNSIWTSYQFMKVFSLAYSGRTLTMEATKVGQTLLTIPTDKMDLRMLSEVQHFATAMNCQEFVLSVYGYFSLSASLMSNVVATAAMYLIILVQFDKTTLNGNISTNKPDT